MGLLDKLTQSRPVLGGKQVLAEAARATGRAVNKVHDRWYGIPDAATSNAQWARDVICNIDEHKPGVIDEAIKVLRHDLKQTNGIQLNPKAELITNKTLLLALKDLAQDPTKPGQQEARSLFNETIKLATRDGSSFYEKLFCESSGYIGEGLSADPNSGKQYLAVAKFTKELAKLARKGKLQSNLEAAVTKLATGYHGIVGEVVVEGFQPILTQTMKDPYAVLDDQHSEVHLKNHDPSGSIEEINHNYAQIIEYSIPKGQINSSLSKAVVGVFRETSLEERGKAVQAVTDYMQQYKDNKCKLEEIKSNLFGIEQSISAQKENGKEVAHSWIPENLLSDSQKVGTAVEMNGVKSYFVQIDKDIQGKVHGEIAKVMHDIDQLDRVFSDDTKAIGVAFQQVPAGFKDLFFKRLCNNADQEAGKSFVEALLKQVTENPESIEKSIANKRAALIKEQTSITQTLTATKVEETRAYDSFKNLENLYNLDLYANPKLGNFKKCLHDLGQDGNVQAKYLLARVDVNEQKINTLVAKLKDYRETIEPKDLVPSSEDHNEWAKLAIRLIKSPTTLDANTHQEIHDALNDATGQIKIKEDLGNLTTVIVRDADLKSGSSTYKTPLARFTKLLTDRGIDAIEISNLDNASAIENLRNNSGIYVTAVEAAKKLDSRLKEVSELLSNINNYIDAKLTDENQGPEILAQIYNKKQMTTVLMTGLHNMGMDAKTCVETIQKSMDNFTYHYGHADTTDFHDLILSMIKEIIGFFTKALN